MGAQRSIVLSGDLGSGKSTVAAELSRRLGMRRVSLGDLHRQIAQSRGMTELQLNRHSERDAGVDAYVDGKQRELAASGEPLIVDSRLGWYFFENAFKVQLKTDPLVAAQRVQGRPASNVEEYGSVAEAVAGLQERSGMERTRFLRIYGVDRARLRNYSLVCDTTSAGPDEVADLIIESYERFPGEDSPELALDPARIQVTRGSGEPTGGGFPLVGYSDPYFFTVGGGEQIESALSRGEKLVRARLLAEFDEPVRVGGPSADEWLAAEQNSGGVLPLS